MAANRCVGGVLGMVIKGLPNVREYRQDLQDERKAPN
jgi:hypothetical protein